VVQSNALDFLQKRALNVIFSGGEHATNLIIASIETLSYDTHTAFLEMFMSLFLSKIQDTLHKL